MIAFASLFLGLVFGVQTVEVVVGQEVAAVELRLDGQRLGVLTEAPYKLDFDFGTELAPRLLEAVALDTDQKEVGRAVQWLNLPQPRAAISVVLEPSGPGEPRIARIGWESAAGAEPESMRVVLDGQPLRVEDRHRVALPPVDERELHLLQVELEFEGRVESRVDLTFGGTYADEVSTEITALPILADQRTRRPPSAAGAKGWFTKDGRPLDVLAVEHGTAEVVVVMDRPFPRLVEPGQRYKPSKKLILDPEERLRFIATIPHQSRGVATTFELFPISQDFGAEHGDLYGLLAGLMQKTEDRPPRPATAVGVAGLAAFEGRHRRAVVLLPSIEAPGEDALTPAQVRRYLERLGVRLFVWNPKSSSRPHIDAWGEVRKVGSFDLLEEAYAELTDFLERQWIVWLDGRHLPQEIALSPAAEGFTLLSREP